MTILKSAMLSTAAAIVALGLAGGAAYAQTESPATGQAGSQVQQDTGAAGQSGSSAGTAVQGQAGATGEAGTQAEGGMQAQGEGGTQAQGQSGTQSGPEVEAESGTQAQSGAGTQTGGEAGTQAQSGTGAQAGADSEAKAKVALDQTQVTEIKQYFTENEPDVESVEVSSVDVSVGVAVPSAVTLHRLPSTIVVNVPSDCPLEYFVWGTDIVIVDSCTRLVLEIIPDVA